MNKDELDMDLLNFLKASVSFIIKWAFAGFFISIGAHAYLRLINLLIGN